MPFVCVHVLGIESRALHILDRCSTSELHPSPQVFKERSKPMGALMEDLKLSLCFSFFNCSNEAV
jgi:hypothetical protein